jgi:hypothetical protein
MTPSYMHRLPRPSIGNALVPVTLFRRKKMMMISTQHHLWPPKLKAVQFSTYLVRDERIDRRGRGCFYLFFFLFNCVLCCSVNSCGELRNPNLLPKDETPCICCRRMVLTGACRNGTAPLSMPHFVNTYLRFRAGRRGALNPTHHTNATMPEQKLLEENCVACPLDPSKSPKIPLQKRSRPREHVYMQLLNPPRPGLWSGQNSSGTLPFYG